jgi:hypothetical protein
LRHIAFLEAAIDRELMKPGTRDPAMLNTLLQQLDEANRVESGIATPTKGGHSSDHEGHGSPEYKKGDQSMLAVQAAKENQRADSDAVSKLGDEFITAHSGFRLTEASSLGEVMGLFSRAVDWFAKAIPKGPSFSAFMRQVMPLDPCRVSPSVVHELKGGRAPAYFEVQRELAAVVVDVAPGSGSAYLQNLIQRRQYVSTLMVDNTEYAALNRTFIRAVRACCNQNILAMVGVIADCVSLGTTLAEIFGRRDRDVTMGAYQSFMATVEMPPMVTGFQLQELLTYMEAAYEVRMNTAALMGMDPALLAFLRMLESMPEGTGAMGPPMAALKASWEEFMSNGEYKNRESVTEFIRKTRIGLGNKRYDGTLVPAPASQLSRQSVMPRSAYAAEPEESPATAAAVPEAGPTSSGSAGGDRKLCHKWVNDAKGCLNEKCQHWHPNGKSRPDRECWRWRDYPEGCQRKDCTFLHPNGKSKKDAPKDGKSTKDTPKDEGEYNKRDLTPSGARRVDTTKHIYDKGDPVKVDPKAAEAHARNKNPRVKVRDPQSD